MVSVTVIQEGAAPTELENQVTRLVENAIAGLPNIEITAVERLAGRVDAR